MTARGSACRRKRTLGGSVTVDRQGIDWELVSEPQWTSNGAQGLQVSARASGEARRELIVEYPFDWLRFHPQRPILTAAIVEASIKDALADGWDPLSRGRSYVFLSSEPLSAATRKVPRLKDRAPLSAR